ncbi:TM0106 family RecB-like putative nuclease [Microbacterium terrisoli]|uniref:TM0106 family RecB-like putative nuclease n=1 Tax=Microbacterium terrisoli TaxID=3242192 RepID=UPI002804EF3C|nr:TM0106 family RecB-like putative nuclease [Microbacterium protaetiae]
MRYIEGEARIVWSASDVKAAAECEFAWLRAIDAKAGRIAAVDDPEDATLARAGLLGTEHERRVLAAYRAQYAAAVVEIPETRSSDAEQMQDAVARTRAALDDPTVQVVYQATFATDEFVGFADFLVRDDDGSWIVQDSKLARHARVTALMQLAAYADQLDLLGVPRAARVELLLGDGTTSVHQVDDLMPVFRLRRERLRALVADRRLERPDEPPIAWGDARGELGVVACGRCATCDLEVMAHRDLLLVAGMRPVQRERLRGAGIDTIDALAAASTPPERMSAETFANLRTQARLQLQSPAGTPVAVAGTAAPAIPTYEVVFPKALGALPRPDQGDIFFDFEGDPLYTEGPARDWGIDYLFGWVDLREEYSALWAHTFADEKAALERFVEIVATLRRAHPGMHIYHYAPYETAHLLAMAARHGVCEAEVDTLLREGVFVDLYPIVRRALKVGSRSYSIKKLEPLYMGEEVRTSDVQRGDDSIVKYVQARALGDAGQDAQAQEVLDDLADYNRYDCVSTRRLRDWLVDRAREVGLVPSRDVEPVEVAYEPAPQADALRVLAVAAEAAGVPETDVRALRLGAAAIDYYPREAKSFWFAHFLRLREPVSVWETTRDVVVIDADRSAVTEQWHPGPRSIRRVVRLRGELAPGTRLSEGSRPYAVYATPSPFPAAVMPRWVHVAREVEVLEVLDDGAIVAETAVDGQTWSELPVALAPSAPPRAGNQQTAIEQWADAVAAASPDFPADAATDILRRRPPRLRGGATGLDTSARTADRVAGITEALRDVDRSYVAVQGPPGTGKTFVGSHVIARLVREQRWKIGVVAQSHAVVEHMLDQVVAAGVPAELVAKARKSGDDAEVSFTAIPKNGLARFAEDHAETGFVAGGTAWDFSHPGRVVRGSLDLLVVDEAGQFSLASTVAVAAAAQRLLLLGDPQQLPQVSQGIHPEPVDASALGWVMDEASVIPPAYGFFLDRSWRMHPAVAASVSQLSYAGELASQPGTDERAIAGVEPGVHPVAVRHHGNATSSDEEAAEVVRVVRDLLGRELSASPTLDGQDAAARALTQSDIIVVTPYNAQQVVVERALADAGFGEVPVGTVDKFQGQEAAVSIVSLAASSGRDAPRGLEFLLLQNRLNVAISRAKVAAYLVYAPGLLDDLPHTPDGVVRLSAFARLVGIR